MIQYLEGEKNILLDSIVKVYGIDAEHGTLHDHSSEAYTFVKINGSICRITVNLLLKIVFWGEDRDFDFYKTLSRDFKMIFQLVHMIPLIKIPLYINSVPDIANWRLRIGK